MVDAEVDPAELHFLILHYLASGPCSQAVTELEHQALANGLLPCRHDVFGIEHKLSYADLQNQYAHIAPDTLPRLLQHALTAQRLRAGLNVEGDRSLLFAGVEQDNATSEVTAPYCKPECLSLCHKHAMQETGASRVPRHFTASTQQCARKMQHHKTIRGHKLAVYCIAFDRAGRNIITGSDDRLVKIWSSQTALLLRSCRGHDGEVTDLAINMESSMVASSSNDHTIRCWSLQDFKLGHPVSVLVGHQGPVTYVDFNRSVPNALLSSSFDGTCRIWDATNSAWPAKVMPACPFFGPMKGVTRFGGLSLPVLPGQPSKPNTRSLQEPASTRNTPVDAANASIEQRLRSSDPLGEAAALSAGAGAADQEASTDPPGLLVCGFSPDGSHIVAGSNDCHIYAWFWDIAAAADKGKAAAKQAFYNVVSQQDAARNLEPAAAIDLEAADWPEPQEVCRLGGHVNDVLLLQFSHDGQCIATGSKDGTMRTWQRIRRRHKKLHGWENKHVLKCDLDDAAVRKAKQKRRAPPVPSVNQLAWSCDDLLVLSSVSDHTIRVWDAQGGVEVQRLVGHQAQVHILECHPFDHKLAMSASYDGTTKLWNLHTGQLLTSFSTQDTRPDVHTSWTDHIQLVDGHWSPDGSSLVVSDVAGQWHAYSLGAPALVKHACYDQFLESDYDRLTRDVNNAVIDDNTQQPPHMRPTRDYLVDYVAVRYGEPYQSAYRSNQVLQLPLKEAQGEGEWATQGLPQALSEFPPTVTAAGWVAQEAEGTDEDIDRAIQRALQRAIAAEAALAAAVVAGEIDLTAAERDEEGEDQAPAADAAADDQPEQAGPSRGAARTRRSAPLPTDDDADMEPEGEEADEWEQWPDADVDISSSDDDAAASDSDASMYSGGGAGGAEGGPRTRAQRRARRRGAEKRPRAGPDHRGQRARKRRRVQESRYAEDASGEEEDLGEHEEEYVGQEGQQRLLRSHRRPVRRSETRSKKQQTKGRRRQTGRAQAGASAQGGRTLDKYAWLQVTWRTPGVYVPQLGDDVVYLQVGHRKFLSANNNKLQGPWDSIVSTAAERRGQCMREIEPAHVVALSYIISNDGASNTCARLTLQLSDPGSPLQGRTFEVDLPPATNGHAEFVIPHHRFLASVHRMWKRGDRCQVFYPDADDVTAAAATCDPWHGQVADVLSHDGEGQGRGEASHSGDPEAGGGEQRVQADPYGCGGLWERFLVHWQPNTQAQAHQDSGDDDASEPSRMCPWELFEEGLDSQQAAAEGPALDTALADSLLQAVHTLAVSHHFAAFHDLLSPDQAYPASDTGVPMYYNTLVALPMSLSLMKDRLQQRYYRQLEGWLGDVATLEGNATAFCGDDSPVTEAAADLARRLRAAADGGDYQEGLSDDEEDEDDDNDAEISELEEGLEPQQHAADEEQEEELDIMHSPARQSWGAEARRSRRSIRSRRQQASPPIPSDSTAVLREPSAGPYHSRLRSRVQGPTAHEEPATSSRHSAHAAWDHIGQNPGIAHGLAAAPRQTRSLRSHDRGGAAATLDGAAGRSEGAMPAGGGSRDGGASVPRHDEQQPQQQGRGGRALRSSRGRRLQPDDMQLQSDDDAQLAQALQESLLTARPVRRSGRNVHTAEQHHPGQQHSGHRSGHQGRSDEAAGPSSGADPMSPSSSRETRAQQRALRTQQLHEASPEPAEAHMPEAEGQLVRRSQRQQTRASSASLEASHRALEVAQRADAHVQWADAPQDESDSQAHVATRQGVSGIKLTLRRRSNAARQRHQEDPADAVHHDHPAEAAVNGDGMTTGLRVSLRSRRS